MFFLFLISWGVRGGNILLLGSNLLFFFGLSTNRKQKSVFLVSHQYHRVSHEIIFYNILSDASLRDIMFRVN